MRRRAADTAPRPNRPTPNRMELSSSGVALSPGGFEFWLLLLLLPAASATDPVVANTRPRAARPPANLDRHIRRVLLCHVPVRSAATPATGETHRASSVAPGRLRAGCAGVPARRVRRAGSWP